MSEKATETAKLLSAQPYEVGDKVWWTTGREAGLKGEVVFATETSVGIKWKFVDGAYADDVNWFQIGTPRFSFIARLPDDGVVPYPFERYFAIE